MAESNKPYLISFCTGTDGHVLDGTPLPEAIDLIDQSLDRPPAGYFVNCTHPKPLTDRHPAGYLTRLIGIQANASLKDVTQLDASSASVSDPVDTWSNAMLTLHETHQVQILGGCFGTTLSHMQHLIKPSPTKTV